MTTIDLKEHVQRAIHSEWPAFARAHPRLAAILDVTLLIEAAAEELTKDSDYQQAMTQAAAAGVAAEAIGSAAREWVGRWLREMV